MNHTGSFNTNDARRPTAPRRVRHGLKLSGRQHATAVTWPVAAVCRWLTRHTDPDERDAGFEYARLGQTRSFDVEPGVIRASIQGRAAKPYEVAITAPVLDNAQWQQIVRDMADEAIYSVKLHHSEWPEELPELFSRHGIALMPSNPQADCTCPADTPCKHIAAAVFILADRLAEQPFLLLRWRGLNVEQIRERLDHTRTMQTHGVAAAHASVMLDDHATDARPLELCIDEFWRSGPELVQLEHAPPPQHVSHALLRRLGPSPLKGRFPITGLLASVYDTVAEEAGRLRDADDPADPDDEPPSGADE